METAKEVFYWVTIVTSLWYTEAMKSITIRDFRSHPKQVQNTLSKEGEALLTSSGKPVALLISVDSHNVDETLALIRRARTQQALQAIRASAQREGLDTLSTEDIDRLIQKTRQRKPARR